jgi:hypothetical protein
MEIHHKIPDPYYPRLFVFRSHLWELSGLVLSLVVGFFGGLFTQARITLILVDIPSDIMWARLCSCVSYHTYILFILNPFPYNTTYPFWFVTSYSCPPFFMVLMWSYHWWSRYPFASVPQRKWVYCSPRYILGYCCSYCFGEWSTCSKGGLPPFPSPHLMTNGYPYHHKWFPDFDGCCHCWLDLHIYGVVSIDDDDNTCSDDGCSRKDIIIWWTKIKHDFVPVAIEKYGCFHSCFDSFFTTSAQTTITHCQRSFLTPSMLVSYYR